MLAQVYVFEHPGKYSCPEDSLHQMFWAALYIQEEALVLVDHNDRISFMNASAEQMTGFKNEEALGWPIRQIYDVFDESILEPETLSRASLQRYGRGAAVGRCWSIRNRAGERRSVVDFWLPLNSQDGLFIGKLVVFRDLTAERRMEDEKECILRKATREMAVGMADEIKNPLTAVYGFLHLLACYCDFERYPEYYEMMRSELDKINAYIDTVLCLNPAHETESDC